MKCQRILANLGAHCSNARADLFLLFHLPPSPIHFAKIWPCNHLKKCPVPDFTQATYPRACAMRLSRVAAAVAAAAAAAAASSASGDASADASAAASAAAVAAGRF